MALSPSSPITLIADNDSLRAIAAVVVSESESAKCYTKDDDCDRGLQRSLADTIGDNGYCVADYVYVRPDAEPVVADRPSTASQAGVHMAAGDDGSNNDAGGRDDRDPPGVNGRGDGRLL